MNTHSVLVGFVVCTAAAISACANPVDETPNKLPTAQVADTASDAAGADAVDAASDATSTGVPCSCLKVGMWYRFSSLVLTSIDSNPNHIAIKQLNTLWKKDIEKSELNFYLEVTAVEDDTVKLTVVNGARVAGTTSETCLMATTAEKIEHPRVGCTLSDSKNASMNVYAGTPQNTKNCAPTLPVKHAIPIKNAKLTSRFSDDCSELLDGKVLTGAMAKSALPKICTCLTLGKDDKTEEKCVPDPDYKGNDCDGCPGYSNLEALLKALSGGEDLKYGCDAAGEPGACIEATFHAVKIDGPPAACKL